jgi:hypothetical protein
MAFKKTQPAKSVPDSPEKLFLDLPRRKIGGVLSHQHEIIKNYVAEALNDSDVAFQLPTGSGKTLVGLLIAEWRRRKYGEKVLYLCPTKQLVNQVVEQADEKYGISVNGFTGSSLKYSPTAKSEYRSADKIAVSTYSSLFNTKPFFDDADVIIIDDAHASESYISDLWSIKIERSKNKHEKLHAAICGILKPFIDPLNYARLTGKWESPNDKNWVDKISTPDFIKIHQQIIEVIDTHAKDAELEHPWSMIRERLFACQLYLSSHEIYIRPLISPTWTHEPFHKPKQRIYMSATLGAGGDLERITGRKNIKRLPIPEGWDNQGVGRRFFMFPEMSLNEDEAKKLGYKLMLHAKRSLVLVPSGKMQEVIAREIETNTKLPIFDAKGIESSKKPFTTSEKAVAVISNRYDGIDFPGDESRLLFIEGLPKAANLQERFLMSRMVANILFNERIQTRVLQSIGRCTRSLEDYSAVVVSGKELPEYLSDVKRRKYFHPELQAELSFGVAQSKNTSSKDLLENFDTFLENGKAWEEVNQQIVSERENTKQETFPAMKILDDIVKHEIDFQTKLWQSDYEAAMASAESVLGKLDIPELRGYRALWNYLAGSAAWLGAELGGVTRLNSKAQTHFESAKAAAEGIPWLVTLARYQKNPITEKEIIITEQIERVEMVLEQFGNLHDRAFSLREKEILEGLDSKDSKPFEKAHAQLGELLGFTVGKVESPGSPDPWWIDSKLCFVFEDHSGANDTSVLDITKARQASSHPNWMEEYVPESKNTKIVPVLISPVSKVHIDAVPHLKGLTFWGLKDFREWAKEVLSTIRELRTTFVEPGDLEWRLKAADIFKQKGYDAESLVKRLNKQMAKDMLVQVK